jgi:hypothetical protein
MKSGFSMVKLPTDEPMTPNRLFDSDTHTRASVRSAHSPRVVNVDVRTHVTPLRLALAVLPLALLACGRAAPVEVRIMRTGYSVGAVRSELATPAVDEVVRLNPTEVVMVVCLSTPAEKVGQFDVEIRARSSATIGLKFAKEGCES